MISSRIQLTQALAMYTVVRLVLAVTAASQTHTAHPMRAHRRNQRGEIEQNVIVWGLMAAAAIGIATLVAAKFTDLASAIPTGN